MKERIKLSAREEAQLAARVQKSSARYDKTTAARDASYADLCEVIGETNTEGLSLAKIAAIVRMSKAHVARIVIAQREAS